jgi:hypothetical protein
MGVLFMLIRFLVTVLVVAFLFVIVPVRARGACPTYTLTYTSSISIDGGGNSKTFSDGINTVEVSFDPIPFSNKLATIPTAVDYGNWITRASSTTAVNVPSTPFQITLTQSSPSAGSLTFNGTFNGIFSQNSGLLTITVNPPTSGVIGWVNYYVDATTYARPGSYSSPGISEFRGIYSSTIPGSVDILNAVSPNGTVLPGTDLSYTVTFNGCGAPVNTLILADPIPNDTEFKVGSVTTNLGTTGLTVSVSYSNDNGASYTYTPVSGGGGSAINYDRNVTHILFSFAGTLSSTSPNNTGNFSFVARIR